MLPQPRLTKGSGRGIHVTFWSREDSPRIGISRAPCLEPELHWCSGTEGAVLLAGVGSGLLSDKRSWVAWLCVCGRSSLASLRPQLTAHLFPPLSSYLLFSVWSLGASLLFWSFLVFSDLFFLSLVLKIFMKAGCFCCSHFFFILKMCWYSVVFLIELQAGLGKKSQGKKVKQTQLSPTF